MIRSVLTRAALTAGVAGVSGVFWSIKDVTACEVPEDSLLNYVSQTQKVWYTDCYTIDVISNSRGLGDSRAVDALCKAFFRYLPASDLKLRHHSNSWRSWEFVARILHLFSVVATCK